MWIGKYIYVESYQALNFGDDLFLKVLFERYPNEKFFIYDMANYKQMSSKYKNAVILDSYLYKVTNLIIRKLHLKKYTIQNILASRCKIAIRIGGSIFMQPWLPELRNDLISRKPFFIIGANFGPYTENSYKENCRSYFESKADICFRDRASYKLFSELSNVRIAPDILWTLKVPNISGQGLFVSVMCFGVSHPELVQFQEKYKEVVLRVVREWIGKGKRVVLASFCKIEGDEIGIQNIVDDLTVQERGRVEIHHYRGNMESTLRTLNSCETVFGTRFHSVVLGLLMGKTVIPICYSNKTENLLDDIGLGDKKNLVSNLEYGNLQECRLSRKRVWNLGREAEAQFQKLDVYLCAE